MSISTIQNFYKETITRAVSLVGATNIYVSALPTPDEGYVVISPSSSSLREIVYYTAKGTDSNGTYLTVTLANRGLGGTTAQTHVIGEPVRMNVTAEHIKEISDALDQIVAGGTQDASTVSKGISKLSVAPVSATNPIAVGDNDPRIVDRPAEIKFGGTGADGALAITTGTTTIDLGGEAVVTKNYTSISITGDGKLAFSNPHANGTIIILKSQGDVTLTSSAAPMIDASNAGAAAGTAGQAIWSATNQGVNGVNGGGSVGTGGAGGDVLVPTYSLNHIQYKHLNWSIGAGGGGGGTPSANNGAGGGGGGGNITAGLAGSNGISAGGLGNGSGGAGGRGGAFLVIECGGAWNFTTANGISVNGSQGGAGTGTGGGGGGGGGAGVFIGLYNTLTANTGTITKAGGLAGTGTTYGGAGGAGGTGYSLVALNTEFS
jgi:hypothetical protein